MKTIRLLLIMVTLLPCTGCQPQPTQAQRADFAGTGHRELRALLSIPSNVLLDEDVIADAWNQKFPVGTSYEQIAGALPASSPRAWPWQVIIQQDRIRMLSYADLDLRLFYLTAWFDINLEFEDGLLVAMSVFRSVLGV